jgi:hypothetical protein
MREVGCFDRVGGDVADVRGIGGSRRRYYGCGSIEGRRCGGKLRDEWAGRAWFRWGWCLFDRLCYERFVLEDVPAQTLLAWTTSF